MTLSHYLTFYLFYGPHRGDRGAKVKNPSLNFVFCLEMNKFIPTGRIDPSSYNQLLDPVEARYRLARAVLAEIPRQVIIPYPDKKKTKNVLIYKEIQMGSGAKSYMRKGFLIYMLGNAQMFNHI
jgi:hypothetical protein